MTALRPLIVVAALIAVWQAIVVATGVQPFILPGPAAVGRAWIARLDVIAPHAWMTLTEIVLGLGLGALLGAVMALGLAYWGTARRWLLPVLVASQAVPVFALAPLLVLWLGYGMASKVAMAALIIFFPVTVAFYDGLRRADPAWLDLASSMSASRLAMLRHIRAPSALPAFASGLRVATAVAPIGAVIGEWVGSGAGLGYLMLQANARMQVDLMFAALATLAVIAVGLYYAIDAMLRRALPWVRESHSPSQRGSS